MPSHARRFSARPAATAITSDDPNGPGISASPPSVSADPNSERLYYALRMFLPGGYVTQGFDPHMTVIDGILDSWPSCYSSYAVLADSPQDAVAQLIEGYPDIIDYSGNYTVTMPDDFNASSGPQLTADLPYYNPTNWTYSGQLSIRPGSGQDIDAYWGLEVYSQYVSISATDTAGEGLTASPGFQLFRGFLSDEAMTVTFDLSGTAEYGVDYTLSGVQSVVDNRVTVSIPANQYTAWIDVNVVEDSTSEWTETIKATLTEGQPFIMMPNSKRGLVEITDDDLGITGPEWMLVNNDDDNSNAKSDFEDFTAIQGDDDL